MEKKEFIKDVDYYLEEGFVIFTEKYLKEREYCCGNGCRHCPYNNVKGPKPLILRSADGTYGTWGTSGITLDDNK